MSQDHKQEEWTVNNRLSIEYNRLLRSLKKDFEKYDPQRQIKIKKNVLQMIPENEVNYQVYLSTVGYYLKNVHVQLTLAQVDDLVHVLGLVKDGKISRSYNREHYDLAMRIL